jgi:hypothetical protein
MMPGPHLFQGALNVLRSFPCGRSILPVVLFFALNATISAQAFTTNDANTILTAFNSDFYDQSGTAGYFKNTQQGGVTYFWGQAELIECVIDSYEWNSNTTSRIMITNLLNGFVNNNGSTWTYDGYNDDILWAVIAFARGGRDTGNTNYSGIAKANFDAVYARAWSTNLGGGLFWEYPENASKNACVNGPGAIAAYLMYQIYGDTNYLNEATNIYAWERSVLFNPGSGAIDDNIGTNGVISTWSSTYNQGTFLGAANFLGLTNDALLAANFTMTSLTTGGILPQYGIAGNNSGFNAIYLRWLVRFINDRQLQALYEPWLQLNANAAWNSRRADNLSWCQWPQPSPAGTNFYAWDCISSFEALQAAAPTQGTSPLAVPADYIGYWPLDAGSGTVAADATGNSNNGVISGATWNTQGRFNDCLSFNGANSYVQITNEVDNDFSIVFWVKTTQTAGTGQWYNGVGLVDGDYPGVANDFGTAMVGGKFAFGVGNPDTTIVSTKAINDGSWHQCVATRQEAIGTMAIYVDGILQVTGAASRNTQNASAHLLLGAIASGGGYFNGSLDEIKIFSRALSSSEVSALYTSCTVPPALAPTNVTAVAGNGQVQLSWDKTATATSFNIKRSLTVGGPYLTITNATMATVTDASVATNRSYFYVVSAVNVAGEGPNSAVVGVTPSSLVAWFRADALTNLLSGAAVSGWPDATGNGYNAIQALSTNQPKYVTGAMNGLPVVRFNAASSDYLWFYRPVQDDFTIICVFQSQQGLNSGTEYYQGAGLVNGEVAGTVNDFGTCLFANGSIAAGTGNPDVSADSSTGYNNGLPHIMTFSRKEGTGVISLYMDSTLVGRATGGTESMTAPNQLVLGGLQTLVNFFTGDMAEVQIYNTALSDTDRLGVEHALKCQYNLTGAVVPASPTGLALTAGNQQVALNWTTLAGSTGYTVWRSLSLGTGYVEIASNLTASSYLDTNAVSGQINYYKITAQDDCGAGTYSAAANVLLPLPSLSLSVTNARTMGLAWPGWTTGWNLYAATNLAPPVIWGPVTNAVLSNNGAFSVTLPIGAGNQYFRLSSP